MEMNGTGSEVLGRDECLALLARHRIGRIAVTSGALPYVLAVNFTLDGDRILIRAGAEGPLGSTLRETVVAFEADDVDPVELTGWSVMVTGVARAVGPAWGSGSLELPGPEWTSGGHDRLVAISTELVTGCRRAAPAPVRG